MNNNPINTLGFIFKKSTVIIKHDDVDDYINGKPNTNGVEYSNYNDRNKVSVFKLRRKDFVMSSIDIATSPDESWRILKEKISQYINKPFIIGLLKNGTNNSFYSKLINVKICDCKEQDLFLFFKYNFIANVFTSNIHNLITDSNYYPENASSRVTSLSNLVYNLEEGEYQGVKFYFHQS